MSNFFYVLCSESALLIYQYLDSQVLAWAKKLFPDDWVLFFLFIGTSPLQELPQPTDVQRESGRRSDYGFFSLLEDTVYFVTF